MASSEKAASSAIHACGPNGNPAWYTAAGLTLEVRPSASADTASIANYAGSETQVCSPHWHLNMLMVRPLLESSIVPISLGSAAQRLQRRGSMVSEPVTGLVLM